VVEIAVDNRRDSVEAVGLADAAQSLLADQQEDEGELSEVPTQTQSVDENEDEDEADVDTPVNATSPEEGAELRELASRRRRRRRRMFLGRQNMYRCMHGVPSFKWSNSLARSAERWANTKSRWHSSRAFKDYGENMCWDMSSTKKCVDFWYDEIEEWDGSLRRRRGAMSRSKWSMLHYAQVVWKRTKYVGCGTSRRRAIMVCQYKPQGCWAGPCPNCWKSNVNGPKKIKSSCR